MRTGRPTPTVTPRGCSGLARGRHVDGRFAPEEEPTCPPGHPHTSWCYSSHGCKCTSCRIYRKGRVRQDAPVLIGAAPIVRRLRALAVIGYGLGELSEMLDMNRGNLAEIRRGERPTVRVATAKGIVGLYQKLHMDPSRHPQAAAIAHRARKAGYHSPLHWTNIDRGLSDDDSGELDS